MWGGLYGLSKIKIRGKWNPYIYENKNIYTIERTEQKPKGTEGVDWVKVYVPCEEKVMYAYIKVSNGDFKYKAENQEEYIDGDKLKHFKGVTITKNNSPIKVKDQTINIYDRLYFSDLDKIGNNLVNAELQINDFENFETNLLNASYDNNGNKKIIIDNIHEYKWLSCNVSLIPESADFDNIAADDDVTICYHTLDNNSNKRILFEQKEEQKEKWLSYVDLYTTVSCKITDIHEEEKTLKAKVLLGTFYIVEDFNYNINTVSNFINPINSGIEDRKILDQFDDKIAEQRFAIDVDKNLKNYNFSLLPEYNKKKLTVFYNPNTMKPYEPNEYSYTKKDGTVITGNYAVIEKGELYYKWTREIADKGTIIGQSVTINKKNFPYNFKLIGETYIRDRYGEDIHYQIELYNCALLDNINLSLQAAGEATTVNIRMKALTSETGDIGRLTIYKDNLEKDLANNQQNKYSPMDYLERIEDLPINDKYNIVIMHPTSNQVFCLPLDCAIPIIDQQQWSYLRLVTPENDDYIGKTVDQYYNEIIEKLEKEDLIIAKVNNSNIIKGFVNESELANYEFVNIDEEVTT